MRSMEERGQLRRAGTVATIGARGVVYELAEVEAAAERLRVARLPPPPKPPRAPLHPPPGMMLAVDVARECGVTVGTVKDWCRSGRLRPAACMVSPSRAHLFTVEDVRDASTVRDYRAPQQRIAAVADAISGGCSLVDALDAADVSPTTWNYWVRHRYDAAEVAKVAAGPVRPPKARPCSRLRGDTTMGRVYFVTGTGPRDAVKIGWTSGELSERLRALQTGSPVELRVMACVRALLPFERWCHRQFEEDRCYGEWFKRTPRLARFAERIEKLGDVSGMTPAELSGLLTPASVNLFGGTHGPTP